MKSLKGCIGGIEQRQAKNGQAYTIITVDEEKFFDWSKLVTQNQIEFGDFVKIEYRKKDENDKFPRLVKIEKTEEEKPTIQQVMKDSEEITQAQKKPNTSDKLAMSREYLLLKMAVELVKCEGIQVDEKIKRVKEAIEEFKKLI